MARQRSPQQRSRDRARARRDAEQRRRRLITIVAGILAAAFLASIAAISLQGRDRNEEDEPTPTPSSEVTPTPTSSQISSTEPSCDTTPDEAALQGAVLAGLDEVEEATLLEGAAVLSVDPEDPREGKGSLRIDMGKREQPATIRIPLPEPIDIQGDAEVSLWLRQNGSVPVGGFDWVVRLSSDGTSDSNRSGVHGVELILEPLAVNAAAEWCHQALHLQELRVVGQPDLAAITSVDVVVPGYPGAGAGQTIWLDGVSFG